jgi:hypothetical protein
MSKTCAECCLRQGDHTRAGQSTILSDLPLRKLRGVMQRLTVHLAPFGTSRPILGACVRADPVHDYREIRERRLQAETWKYSPQGYSLGNSVR